MSRLDSENLGAFTRLVSAFAGALALAMALFTLLFLVDRALRPGNPDAGQLAVVGIVIGLPLGFVIGWLVARHKQVRRVFLAASVGAFMGSMVGGYVIEADFIAEKAKAAVGLVFTLAGCAAGGGVLARRRAETTARSNAGHTIV
jgi:hypothetical protein